MLGLVADTHGERLSGVDDHVHDELLRDPRCRRSSSSSSSSSSSRAGLVVRAVAAGVRRVRGVAVRRVAAVVAQRPVHAGARNARRGHPVVHRSRARGHGRRCHHTVSVRVRLHVGHEGRTRQGRVHDHPVGHAPLVQGDVSVLSRIFIAIATGL